MRCNCESLRCPICKGNGCKNEAGAHKALYVGVLCDGCAEHMPPEYMVADTAIECPDCGSTAHILCGEAPVRESTLCECGHSKLVHLHTCQVKGCRKCKGFKPAVR